MKRSEINKALKELEKMIADHQYYLPKFANFTPEEWKTKGHEFDEIRDNMLGWDITDYGMGDFDKYGRLLRYVYLANGENVNEYMVSNGFAFEYTYNKKYLMRDVFLKEQASAKLFGRGLWSLQTCDGKL